MKIIEKIDEFYDYATSGDPNTIHRRRFVVGGILLSLVFVLAVVIHLLIWAIVFVPVLTWIAGILFGLGLLAGVAYILGRGVAL